MSFEVVDGKNGLYHRNIQDQSSLISTYEELVEEVNVKASSLRRRVAITKRQSLLSDVHVHEAIGRA
jgi:hypothetical protein